MVILSKKMKNKLSEIMTDKENVIYTINAVSPKYKNTISFGKTLYTVLTNKKIILLDNGVFNIDQSTIGLEKIDVVNKKDKILNSNIYIHTNSTQIIIEGVEKKEANNFVNHINKQLENFKSFSIEINKTIERDITDKIEKLAELYKDGVLTEYEFSIKKMELLEKLKK